MLCGVLRLSFLAALLAGALAAAGADGGSGPWETLRRPLHLPQLAPGATCPLTRSPTPRVVAPDGAVFVGRGPVYASFRGFAGQPHDPLESSVLPAAALPPKAGSHFVRVTWYVSARQRSRVLVRGRRLDGAGALRFGSGSAPSRDLRVISKLGSRQERWRVHRSWLRVRASGCYGVQIDGPRFSRTLVFRVAIVDQGGGLPHRVYTHCGVIGTEAQGERWRADPRIREGYHRGAWGPWWTDGRFFRLSPESAVFVADRSGSAAYFVRGDFTFRHCR